MPCPVLASRAPQGRPHLTIGGPYSRYPSGVCNSSISSSHNSRSIIVIRLGRGRTFGRVRVQGLKIVYKYSFKKMSFGRLSACKTFPSKLDFYLIFQFGTLYKFVGIPRSCAAPLALSALVPASCCCCLCCCGGCCCCRCVCVAATTHSIGLQAAVVPVRAKEVHCTFLFR